MPTIAVEREAEAPLFNLDELLNGHVGFDRKMSKVGFDAFLDSINPLIVKTLNETEPHLDRDIYHQSLGENLIHNLEEDPIRPLSGDFAALIALNHPFFEGFTDKLLRDLFAQSVRKDRDRKTEKLRYIIGTDGKVLQSRIDALNTLEDRIGQKIPISFGEKVV